MSATRPMTGLNTSVNTEAIMEMSDSKVARWFDGSSLLISSENKGSRIAAMMRIPRYSKTEIIGFSTNAKAMNPSAGITDEKKKAFLDPKIE